MSKLNQLKAEGKIAGWWDFRRGSLLDLSGNGNDAVASGTGASWANTRRGRGYNTSASGVLTVADSPSLQRANGVILVFGWFEKQDVNARIVSKRDVGGTNYDFYTAATTINFFDGVSERVITTDTRNSNMVGVKFTANGVPAGYKNGVNIGNFSGASTVTVDDAPLLIGNYRTGALPYNNPITQIVIINDSTVTDEDIATIYNEYMLEQGAGDPKTGNYRFRNVITGRENGAAAAWNMEQLGGKIVDLTGNGNTGTASAGLAGVVTPAGLNALKFNGVSTNVNCGSLSGVLETDESFTVACHVKNNDLANFRQIWSKQTSTSSSGGAGAGMNVSNIGRVNVYFYDGAGNRVLLGTGVASDKYATIVLEFNRTAQTLKLYQNNVLIDSTTGVVGFTPATAQDFVVGRLSYGNTWFYDGEVSEVIVYNRILSDAERANLNNGYAKLPTYLSQPELWTPTLANVTAGRIGNTDFTRETGTWKVSEDANKKKWIELVLTGSSFAVSPFTKAYGTWVFDFYPTASTSVVSFISNFMGGYSDASQTGYAFYTLSTGAVALARNVNGSFSGNILMGGTLALNVAYKVAITRSLAGIFTIYIKGGIYINWTLLPVTSGTNPATNNVYTTSKYFIYHTSGAGDKISDIRHYQGILDLTTLPLN